MNRDEALALYRQMLLIRRFEERSAQMYVEGRIGGFLHLYIGHEAVGVGAISLMRPDDYFIAYYRDHGYSIARGSDVRPLLAELCGKATGISRGKGGSMHFFDVPRGNFGGDGIVGGHLPVAAGIAYGIRLKQTDQVCLCFFGDGSVNEGAFHEALNVSALWDLPVVYIIENNRYGMGTSVDRASSVADLYQRGSAYGIPRREVNGMDLVAVREVVGEAIDRARKEKRPALIEAETYRYRGHSMSDPGKYRTKDEVEQMMKADPIVQFARRLMEQERVTQAELDELDKDVLAEMDSAVEFMEQSPWPTVDSLYEDVYVRSPYINMKAAERDPAWKASRRDDRVPEELPPFQRPTQPPQGEAPPESAPAPEAGVTQPRENQPSPSEAQQTAQNGAPSVAEGPQPTPAEAGAAASKVGG
jgi:pyruvate dehydrogenase E1 component alpha subunit